MIIIGDAAQAVSPSTGQGVSLAAEDAVVLAWNLPARPCGGTRHARNHARTKIDQLRGTSS